MVRSLCNTSLNFPGGPVICKGFFVGDEDVADHGLCPPNLRGDPGEDDIYDNFVISGWVEQNDEDDSVGDGEMEILKIKRRKSEDRQAWRQRRDCYINWLSGKQIRWRYQWSGKVFTKTTVLNIRIPRDPPHSSASAKERKSAWDKGDAQAVVVNIFQ